MTIYDLGWPTDPFKRLTVKEMAVLLKRIKEATIKGVGEALL